MGGRIGIEIEFPAGPDRVRDRKRYEILEPSGERRVVRVLFVSGVTKYLGPKRGRVQ